MFRISLRREFAGARVAVGDFSEGAESVRVPVRPCARVPVCPCARGLPMRDRASGGSSSTTLPPRNGDSIGRCGIGRASMGCFAGLRRRPRTSGICEQPDAATLFGDWGGSTLSSPSRTPQFVRTGDSEGGGGGKFSNLCGVNFECRGPFVLPRALEVEILGILLT